MPKVTIYVPDELFQAARSVEPPLNISAICQRGLREALGIPVDDAPQHPTIQINYHVDGMDARKLVLMIRDEARRMGVKLGNF